MPKLNLLVYKIKAYGKYEQTLNVVTDKDPLIWLVEHMRDYPDESYMLLNCIEVADTYAARWCMDKNGGEPDFPE
jgi:hypothetical protein